MRLRAKFVFPVVPAGPISPELGNLEKLETLLLNDNQLAGELTFKRAFILFLKLVPWMNPADARVGTRSTEIDDTGKSIPS